MKLIKQIKYIFLLVIVLSTSCSNLLDVENLNTTSAEGFIKDRQSVNNVLASAYITARRAIVIDAAWLVFSDLRTGHLKMNSATGVYVAQQNLMASTVELNKIRNWNYFLESIYQCNLLIENAENAKEKLSEDELNAVMGSAYFLRGLMHFYMTQIWGDCPIVLSTNNGKTLSRNSVSAVMEQVIKDATMAFEL